MDHVVIDHHLDENAGVYLVAIGRPVVTEVPKVNDDGTEVRGEDDAPVMETRVAGYLDVEDFVFDASDLRWFTEAGDRRPDEDVAADQRDAIVSALLAREVAVQGQLAEVTREVSSMPGIGDMLKEVAAE